MKVIQVIAEDTAVFLVWEKYFLGILMCAHFHSPLKPKTYHYGLGLYSQECHSVKLTYLLMSITFIKYIPEDVAY